MKKRILSFILAMTLVLLPFAVSAQTFEPYSLQWENISRCGANLVFSGTTGNVKCNVSSMYSTATISGIATLMENGNEIYSWVVSSTRYAYVIDTFEGIPGCAYYVVLDVTVSYNGYDEPLRIESDVAYCPDAD